MGERVRPDESPFFLDPWRSQNPLISAPSSFRRSGQCRRYGVAVASISARVARLPAVCLPRWRCWNRGRRTSSSSTFSRRQRCRRLKVLPAPTIAIGPSSSAARFGWQRPARLRAHLARGGAASADKRTAAYRRGVASGFSAGRSGVCQSRRVCGSRACNPERRTRGYRRGQSSNAAHPRRELCASRPVRCASERRCADCRICSSEDRRNCGSPQSSTMVRRCRSDWGASQMRRCVI